MKVRKEKANKLLHMVGLEDKADETDFMLWRLQHLGADSGNKKPLSVGNSLDKPIAGEIARREHHHSGRRPVRQNDRI